MRSHHIRIEKLERKQLEELLSRGSLPVRVHKRALGILELSKGKRYEAVSDLLNVSSSTVQRWAKKYREGGLSFLTDKPRSGRPAVIDGKLRAKITALACSAPPKGYGKWSLRLLADRIVALEFVEAISHTEVGRILKKMNCNLIEKDNGA